MNPTPLIRGCNGEPILSVEDWLRVAPPKRGLRQWKDFRSAKELANSWFRSGTPRMPADVLDVLNSGESCLGFVPEFALPECKIPLDDFPGETRNADMLIVGHATGGKVVVSIEAKADEPYGTVIGDYLESVKGRRSNVPNRIQQLCAAIFGKELDNEIRALHYQLLHGYAATL